MTKALKESGSSQRPSGSRGYQYRSRYRRMLEPELAHEHRAPKSVSLDRPLQQTCLSNAAKDALQTFEAPARFLGIVVIREDNDSWNLRDQHHQRPSMRSVIWWVLSAMVIEATISDDFISTVSERGEGYGRSCGGELIAKLSKS